MYIYYIHIKNILYYKKKKSNLQKKRGIMKVGSPNVFLELTAEDH